MGVYYFAVLFRDPLYIPAGRSPFFEGVDDLRALLTGLYGKDHMPTAKVDGIQILLLIRHIERHAI